jgi:hypothetical protein
MKVEKVTPAEYERLMAARRMARSGKAEDRNRLIVRGLRVFAKRFTEAGDAASGKRYAEAADKAEAALKIAEAANSRMAEPTPDFVGEAAARAGKTLFKLLPDAFTSAEGAACWAQGALPMAEARQKLNDAQAAKARVAKARGVAIMEFTKIVEAAAMDACSSHDTARCLRELVSLARATD